MCVCVQVSLYTVRGPESLHYSYVSPCFVLLWVSTLSGVCPPADMVARIFLLISLPVLCARLLLPWPISVGKIFLSQLSACK